MSFLRRLRKKDPVNTDKEPKSLKNIRVGGPIFMKDMNKELIRVGIVTEIISPTKVLVRIPSINAVLTSEYRDNNWLI